MRKNKKSSMLVSFLRSKISMLLIIGIILLGIFLRNNNLNTWPRMGATFDEYAWTWQGISLIKTGTPTSWSYHPQYKNKKEIKYQKAAFVLVTPYLEHPPVFGLVAGSYALINGANGMFDISIEKIRGLALIMGTISILLVYFLTKKLYDQKTALLASLLYATIPTIVVGSRLVENENFFIPMWLASLLLIASFIDKKKSWMRNLAAVLCGLLMLAKVPWVAAPFSVCIILLYNKQYKDIVKFLAIVVPLFALYFVYGFYYDRDVFLGLWGLQLNRYDISFTSIFALFQVPLLADRTYLDGWIFAGWITFFVLCAKDFKKHLIVTCAILSYFLVFLVAIPNESGHGWYRYPFYPFLIISSAVFIREYFAKNFLLTFFFLVFVGTSLFGLTWEKTFGFSYVLFRLVIIGLGLTLIPQYLPNKMSLKYGKLICYGWFAIFILMNIWAVLIYNEQ